MRLDRPRADPQHQMWPRKLCRGQFAHFRSVLRLLPGRCLSSSGHHQAREPPAGVFSNQVDLIPSGAVASPPTSFSGMRARQGVRVLVHIKKHVLGWDYAPARCRPPAGATGAGKGEKKASETAFHLERKFPARSACNKHRTPALPGMLPHAPARRSRPAHVCSTRLLSGMMWRLR